MIKVSDYIIKRLVDYGVRDVFMISGGGAMHLNDSVGRNENIRYICNHHEQASAIAAEGYARASGKLAVVIVTSGPGGTNTITGVTGQWLDSVPVLYISGQVKRETTIASCPDIPLRQLGDQEINIVDIVRPITKFAAQIDDPSKVGCLLDEAIFLATHGRPGPVWLDVPLDVQGAMIDEDSLPSFVTYKDELTINETELRRKVTESLELISKAERPVLLAGHGIRIAGAQQELLEIVSMTGMPVVSSMNGFDLIDSDNPNFVGRIGTIADRAGNFAVQNCDLLLSIGSRNNIRQISYNWGCFARCAKKVIVDIDSAELQKPTIRPDIAIRADAGEFLRNIKEQIDDYSLPTWNEWLEWCLVRRKKYPVVSLEYLNIDRYVDPYLFMNELGKCLSENSVVVAGNGTAFLAMFQAGIVKMGQRYIWNSGCASMGYDLPASIGAAFVNGRQDVVCLAGDGSLQMNIQELQTIVYHRLPIKLFVLNNDGYISIKQTQDNFFNGRKVACDDRSGVGFPDIRKIALSYDIPYVGIDNQKDMGEKIDRVLKSVGPIICEVFLARDYRFAPKNASQQMPDGRIVSKPLEDMYPFLEREEFESNMIIRSLRENE